MTVIETLKYLVTPGEAVRVTLRAQIWINWGRFIGSQINRSGQYVCNCVSAASVVIAMSTQLLASELLNLESSTNSKVNSQSDKAKSSTKYAIVYWIETKEFNVMPLSRIPKDKREQGASATLKAERRDWETKIVKIGGE